MTELTKLKDERSKAKRGVTFAVKRIKEGITLKMDPETVHNMSKNLDNKYCVFLDNASTYREECQNSAADESFTVVNGLTLDQYEADVRSEFSKAREMYDIYVASHLTQHTPQSHSSTTPSHPVQLKKREIPTFSGLRKDWPEFKSLWEKIVVPALPNRTALASELKKSCKGGPAIHEISNISAGADDAYNLMWSNLCAHYGNVTLSVVSAIDEIKKLTKVS